jgi:Domain of unknown function (DUF2017)
MRTFQRAADGRLVVSFAEGHIALLDMLLNEIRSLIESNDRDAGSGEPTLDDAAATEPTGERATKRLFPTAYLDPTEERAEQEWQALVHDELVRTRISAFDDVHRVLTAGRPGPSGAVVVELDAEQEEHLLGVLNDTRLVLAEIVAGADEGATDSGTRRDAVRATDVLEWLTDLVSELVELKLGQ